MERTKVLWIGDAVVPTGFGRVNHSIIENLPKLYDISFLGINYYGDPHEYSDLKIYPAVVKGDIYGLNRLHEFANEGIDLIFILNDIWIINQYLEKIKELFKSIPKIVVYFPIDSLYPDQSWFQNFDIVSKAIVYTQFGYDVVKEIASDIDVEIIAHGTDTDTFYQMEEPLIEIKKQLYPHKDEFLNSFIVLNANRNQPRKRLDVSIEGFALFSENKPENVKYYHHAGIIDAGYDVIKLSKRFGMEERLILTNLEKGVQKVPNEKLNLIYNGTDVGINTSLGEGWGLTNVEHAATLAPQIVPKHSSCEELFEDCGLLIPTSQNITFESTMTVGRICRPEDVAEQLEKVYADEKLFDVLAKKSYGKFTSYEYSWKKVAEDWHNLFIDIL
jgi:glycosyltransferase involved in cell wall biosynthesis